MDLPFSSIVFHFVALIMKKTPLLLVLFLPLWMMHTTPEMYLNGTSSTTRMLVVSGPHVQFFGNPCQCLGYFSPKHKDAKISVNHLNPVMLVFIR